MKKFLFVLIPLLLQVAFANAQRSNLSVKNLNVSGQLSTPAISTDNTSVLVVQPGGIVESYEIADTIRTGDIRNSSMVPGYSLTEALNELYNQDPIQANVFPELGFVYEIRKNGTNYQYRRIVLKFDDFGRLKYFTIESTWITITE